MLYFYGLKTRLKNEEIISAIKDYKAIAIRPDLGALKEFINACHELAEADFKHKKNIAQKLQIEWLCRIACTKNINKAIDFCQMNDGRIAIISEKPISKNILEKIGTEFKLGLNGEIESKVLLQYSINGISLEKYDLQELLGEKSLVSFLE